MLVKQGTTRNVMVFMTLTSDPNSGATGLTLTITLSKDGGAFSSVSPTVTERGNGWYSVALSTAHTDTLGDLAMHLTGTGSVGDWKAHVVAELPGFLSATGIDQIYDEAMSGHTTAGTFGDQFRAHLAGVQKIVVAAGSSTTSIVLNSSTGVDGAAPSASDDVYNGRVLMFITGACAKQATSVSDYVGSTKTLTVVALTTAPSAGDQAILV
jgi:hypothetical protein